MYGSGNNNFFLDLILGGWEFAVTQFGNDIALTLTVLCITSPIALIIHLKNR